MKNASDTFKDLPDGSEFAKGVVKDATQADLLDNVVCPFCLEGGFDFVGLKMHLLLGWCDKFKETSIDVPNTRERRASPDFGSPAQRERIDSMTGDRQTENAASEGTCASPCSEIVPWGYALFEHMEKEHGLILVESEINDIISVVKSIIDPNYPHHRQE